MELPVLPTIREMDDNASRKQGRATEALRTVLRGEASQTLRNGAGSETARRDAGIDAGMKTCMSCDKFDCSEMTVCDRWDYCPGTDA